MVTEEVVDFDKSPFQEAYELPMIFLSSSGKLIPRADRVEVHLMRVGLQGKRVILIDEKLTDTLRRVLMDDAYRQDQTIERVARWVWAGTSYFPANIVPVRA